MYVHVLHLATSRRCAATSGACATWSCGPSVPRRSPPAVAARDRGGARPAGAGRAAASGTGWWRAVAHRPGAWASTACSSWGSAPSPLQAMETGRGRSCPVAVVATLVGFVEHRGGGPLHRGAGPVIGPALALLGAVLTLLAAVGVVRFPDVLARMHALPRRRRSASCWCWSAPPSTLDHPNDVTSLLLAGGAPGADPAGGGQPDEPGHVPGRGDQPRDGSTSGRVSRRRPGARWRWGDGSPSIRSPSPDRPAAGRSWPGAPPWWGPSSPAAPGATETTTGRRPPVRRRRRVPCVDDHDRGRRGCGGRRHAHRRRLRRPRHVPARARADRGAVLRGRRAEPAGHHRGPGRAPAAARRPGGGRGLRCPCRARSSTSGTATSTGTTRRSRRLRAAPDDAGEGTTFLRGGQSGDARASSSSPPTTRGGTRAGRCTSTPGCGSTTAPC